MKHSTWPRDFDCSTFTIELDRLTQIEFATVENPLEALLALIGSKGIALSAPA
jgi:hypothetical protein